MAADVELKQAEGALHFRSMPGGLDLLRTQTDAELNWLAAEQSNSSLTIGDQLMLKIYRRILPGEHPESEMGRYLTAQGFAHTPPLLGDVIQVASD